MEISVVIPLYNKEHSILTTLETVFQQELPPKEVIVVDDGSTDNSSVLVEKLNHPLVRLIRQSNEGVSVARNRGVSESTSNWVAFLDADDRWDSTHLANFNSLHQRFPEAQMLAATYSLENFQGQKKNIILRNIPFEGESGLLTNYFLVASTSHPPIWSSSVMVSKKGFESVGGFPVGIKSGEDLITWAKLAVHAPVAYSLIATATFVQDPAHTYDDKPNRVPAEPDLIGEALLELLQSNPQTAYLDTYLAHWAKMRASVYLRLGMKTKAWNEIIKSLRFNPSNYRLYIYLVLLLFPSSLTRKVFKKMGS